MEIVPNLAAFATLSWEKSTRNHSKDDATTTTQNVPNGKVGENARKIRITCWPPVPNLADFARENAKTSTSGPNQAWIASLGLWRTSAK